MIQRFARLHNVQLLNRVLRAGVARPDEQCSFCVRHSTSSLFTKRTDEPMPEFEAGGPNVPEDEGDRFGTLHKDFSEKLTSDFNFIEEDGDAQDQHEMKVADIHRPGKQDYLRQLNHLIHVKTDLRSALDLLETEMKTECVQPQQPHYRLLIHACAKAGHVTKAFQLYREFKERGLPRHVGIYTDLFLACTNTTDRSLGLEKATYMLNELREKHFNPNRVLYNSIIQAFGRCGDLKTAFNLVDEMKEQKFALLAETYNFLLQGCLTDKVSGFRHALIVWRNMRRKKISPDIHTYNLIIRSANECGLGSLNLLQDVLLESVPAKQRKLLEKRIGDPEQGVSTGKAERNWWEMDISLYENLPDKLEIPETSLLEKSANLENIVALNLQDTPQNRLMLLGGPVNIVRIMKEDKVAPDMKTISILLLNHSSTAHEQELLTLIQAINLKPDIAFFNQLIMQRAMRRDYAAGIHGLTEMVDHGLSPDVITFGCLAMCCHDRKTGLNLLSDLHKYGAKPNSEILGTLIKGAAGRLDPADVKLYLEITRNKRVAVNHRILNTVEKFHQIFRNHIKTKEEGGHVPYPVMQEFRQEYKNWKLFTQYYKDWLTHIRFDATTNPVDQYRTIKDQAKEKKEKEERREKKERMQEERTRRAKEELTADGEEVRGVDLPKNDHLEHKKKAKKSYKPETNKKLKK